MSPHAPRFPSFRLSAWWFVVAVVLAMGLSSTLSARDGAASSSATRAPVAVRRVSPEYPANLKKELMKGEAVLECLVDTDGRAQEIKILSETHEGFGAAAVNALEQWEFTPGIVAGKPAALRIRIPFAFDLSPEEMLEVVAGRPVFMEIKDTVIPAMQLPAWPRPKQFYIPRYPAELDGSGKYGKAVVNITIDRSGKVINPQIVKATYPEFMIPALITALKLEFPPQVMANGEKIFVNLDIQFDFKVPDKDRAAKGRAEKAGKAANSKP